MSMPDEETLTYFKNGVDYSGYATLFINDPESYNSRIIHLVRQEQRNFQPMLELKGDEKIVLYMLNSKKERISSAVLISSVKHGRSVLYDSYTFFELKRANTKNFKRKTHANVVKWYKDVNGDDTDSSGIFDNITFETPNGEDVALWQVLKLDRDINIAWEANSKEKERILLALRSQKERERLNLIVFLVNWFMNPIGWLIVAYWVLYWVVPSSA